jgi:hypothetical protein
MSNQILQAGRALAVIPSDNARIPYPQVVVTGINSDVVSAGQLVDPNVEFTYVGVGDVVYNITEQTAATVTQVVDANTLDLNANIFPNYDCVYIIYQQSPQTGNGNQGCVLYVGGTGDLEVVTTGFDDVTFFGIIGGSFIPVHVVQVKSTLTSATNIIALW